MRNIRTLAILTACTLLVTGCGVNKSIQIADGETVDGSKATVNGSVRIGSDCTVRGDCRTVNGRVTVGAGSEVGGLQSVNGSIKIAENVTVDGEVGTVNGSIPGSVITDDITTVNGSIHLSRTEVGGNLGTVNGSVTLEDNSRVSGNVLIKGKSTRYGKKKPIEIRISGGSVVEGDIIVRDPKRTVKVILPVPVPVPDVGDLPESPIQLTTPRH